MSEEHLRCSEVVKGVHLKLRRLAADRGADVAWKMHCSEKDLLKEYAIAMRELALVHWPTGSDASARCRIRWIENRTKKYFFQDMKLVRAKEISLCEKLNLSFDIPETFVNDDDFKISVLDVGSCYNPFSACEFMNVLPVDLSPAVPSVLKCDFLNVNIGDVCSISENSVTELKRNSFDLIIFSLLLEYIPTSSQRLKCCTAAYSLLKCEGILAIVSPDSKHVGANAKIFKNWRYALASIGFSRIVYEKLPSLHCMIFRKAINPDITKRWGSLHKESYMTVEINIPQDFQDISENNNIQQEMHENQNALEILDASSVIHLFHELPAEYT